MIGAILRAASLLVDLAEYLGKAGDLDLAEAQADRDSYRTQAGRLAQALGEAQIEIDDLEIARAKAQDDLAETESLVRFLEGRVADLEAKALGVTP